MIKSGGASTFGDLSLKYFNIFTAPLSIRNCHEIHIIFDQYWHSSIKEGVKDRLRFIPVHDVSRALGPGKCEALLALHALTGCDSNSSLAGIVKEHSPTKAVTMEALAIPKICNQLGPVKLNLHENPHLKNLNFADSYPRESVEVDVLIGADFYYSFATGNCKRGNSPTSPTAVESNLGWILTGPVENTSKSTTSVLAVVENNEITDSLKRFWELESIGITENKNPVLSKEEQRAIEDFNCGLKFDGSNYEVRLPWKQDCANLGDNYQQAVQRLEGVERRLKREPEKAKAYTDAINQLSLKRGLRTAGCGLRAADCGLRAADCGLRAADCGLRAADCGLRAADCGLWNL
ncbi:hypothetical protein QZH41_007520 [Actinostola sp. cb2023]|nr:hypothetical protein QZH41_007520 [Actinostola sp. cb2023]